MKRSMTLLLPLLIVLASCGTTAQYSQQRYQDGIYFQTTEEPEEVVVLSKEDFERLAAQNIRQEAYEEALNDSTKVKTILVYPGDYYYDMYFSPFPTIALWAGTNLAFTSWYWNRWHNWWGPFYGPRGPYDTFWFDFNRPYFGWGSWGWYDPWYYGPGWGYGWYDPWYYRYGPGWYRPYGPYYPGGGGFIRDVSYGPRYQTQSIGSRTVHPGSGASVRRSGTSGYGSRGYIGPRGGTSTGTRVIPSVSGSDRSLSEGYNRRAVSPSISRSSSGTSTYNRNATGSSSRTYSRPSTNSSYSRSSSSSSYSSRSYSGNSSSSRSYSGSSSSSRSYSSGGGGYSGGGGSYSSGSSSHSGGGGGSHGGRR